jgi:hypothetical protein
MKKVIIPANKAQGVIAKVVNHQRGQYHYQVQSDDPHGVVLTSKEDGAMEALIAFLRGTEPGGFEVEEIPD